MRRRGRERKKEKDERESRGRYWELSAPSMAFLSEFKGFVRASSS